MAVKFTPLKNSGFTLIETVISIVIIAIAMISMTSFLFPQIQDSARPHYEVRATALANSLMTEIIARGYDHNSDPDGGMVRCGEEGTSCTSTFGPDDSSEIDSVSGTRYPANFNDVDDYLGCWYTNEASKADCIESQAGNLTDILGADISTKYPNFAANIKVEGASVGGANQFKKISVTITAGRYGDYTFSAFRGNY